MAAILDELQKIKYKSRLALILPRLRDSLSKERFDHSFRVAKTAKALALHYGKNPDKAFFAGMTHDLAREWPIEDIQRVAALDGQALEAHELETPLLLHGRAAAWVLFSEYGVRSESILSAIRYHTLGSPGMGTQAKLLFAADYLEPGRKFIDGSFRHSTHDFNLDDLVLACIHHNIQRGKGAAPLTLALARALNTNSSLGIVIPGVETSETTEH